MKSKIDVVVSYAREDLEFVNRLSALLRTRSFDVWYDTIGLIPGEYFRDEIRNAIDAAPAVVFIVTPDSLASPYCRSELKYAVERQKRLVPVLRRDVLDGTAPDKIAEIHWVPFRDGDGDGGIELLDRAIRADWIWLRQHARLLTRSREWEFHSRERSRLLRGPDLAAAESWLKQAPSGRERAIPLQHEFIAASRGATVRRRVVVAASVCGALIALAAALALAIEYYVSDLNSRVREGIGQSETDSSVAMARDYAARATAVCRYLPIYTVECRDADLNLGIAERAAGNSDESLKALSHAITSISGSPRNSDDELLALAIARWERAVTMIQFAERANDDHERAGRYASASADMTEALKLVDRFPPAEKDRVVVTRARLLVAAGDYERARTELESMNAPSPEKELVLGLAYKCLGQGEEGLRHLQLFVSALPNGTNSPQYRRERPFLERNIKCTPLVR